MDETWQGRLVVVDADIASFFDYVDHDLLLDAVANAHLRVAWWRPCGAPDRETQVLRTVRPVTRDGVIPAILMRLSVTLATRTRPCTSRRSRCR